MANRVITKAAKWVPSKEDRALARKVVLYYHEHMDDLVGKVDCPAGTGPRDWERSLYVTAYLLLAGAKERAAVYLAAYKAEAPR